MCCFITGNDEKKKNSDRNVIYFYLSLCVSHVDSLKPPSPLLALFEHKCIFLKALLASNVSTCSHLKHYNNFTPSRLLVLPPVE